MTARNEEATDHDGGDVTDGAEWFLRPIGEDSATFCECLDALGLHVDELLSMGVRPKGGGFRGPQMTVRELKDLDPAEWADCDVWAGLQPERRVESGWGTAEDVQLVAIYADLDIGPGKRPNEEALWGVNRILSGLLGSPPAYLTFSGHGYQPVWLVHSEDGQLSELSQEVLAGCRSSMGRYAVGASGTPSLDVGPLFGHTIWTSTSLRFATKWSEKYPQPRPALGGGGS